MNIIVILTIVGALMMVGGFAVALAIANYGWPAPTVPDYRKAVEKTQRRGKIAFIVGIVGFVLTATIRLLIL